MVIWDMPQIHCPGSIIVICFPTVCPSWNRTQKSAVGIFSGAQTHFTSQKHRNWARMNKERQSAVWAASARKLWSESPQLLSLKKKWFKNQRNLKNFSFQMKCKTVPSWTSFSLALHEISCILAKLFKNEFLPALRDGLLEQIQDLLLLLLLLLLLSSFFFLLSSGTFV